MARVSLYMLACFWVSLTTLFAAENCTPERKTAVCRDDSVKQNVEWACEQVRTLGAGAIPLIQNHRYDCCGEPDYVWINDLSCRIVIHPIKVTLSGVNVRYNQDPQGKYIFRDFVESVKRVPEGAWVDYLWTKYGDIEPTPKKSWVKKCKVGQTNEYWVVGSGTWK